MATTRKRAARKTSNKVDATPRHLWLASLGLLVAARRQVRSSVVKSRDGLQARLAPVLETLGLRQPPKRSVRRSRRVTPRGSL